MKSEYKIAVYLPHEVDELIYNYVRFQDNEIIECDIDNIEELKEERFRAVLMTLAAYNELEIGKVPFRIPEGKPVLNNCPIYEALIVVIDVDKDANLPEGVVTFEQFEQIRHSLDYIVDITDYQEEKNSGRIAKYILQMEIPLVTKYNLLKTLYAYHDRTVDRQQYCGECRYIANQIERIEDAFYEEATSLRINQIWTFHGHYYGENDDIDTMFYIMESIRKSDAFHRERKYWVSKIKQFGLEFCTLVYNAKSQLTDFYFESDCELGSEIDDRWKEYFKVVKEIESLELSEADEIFLKLCNQKYREMFRKESLQSAERRMNYERDLIVQRNASAIFLKAKDICDYSRRKGYPVTFKGNIAASFVSYLLGITELNPLSSYYKCVGCESSILKTPDKTTSFERPYILAPICNVCGAEMVGQSFNLDESLFFQRSNDTMEIIIGIAPEVYEKVREYSNSWTKYGIQKGAKYTHPVKIILYQEEKMSLFAAKYHRQAVQCDSNAIDPWIIEMLKNKIGDKEEYDFTKIIKERAKEYILKNSRKENLEWYKNEGDRKIVLNYMYCLDEIYSLLEYIGVYKEYALIIINVLRTKGGSGLTEKHMKWLPLRLVSDRIWEWLKKLPKMLYKAEIIEELQLEIQNIELDYALPNDIRKEIYEENE